MRAALAIALLACAILGAGMFALDQRLQHQAACLSALETAVSPHVPAAMRSGLLDGWERQCP